MDEDLKKIETPADKDTSARNKKMRSWLGVKRTFSTNGHPDDFGPIFYGDGHSGWNR